MAIPTQFYRWEPTAVSYVSACPNSDPVVTRGFFCIYSSSVSPFELGRVFIWSLVWHKYALCVTCFSIWIAVLTKGLKITSFARRASRDFSSAHGATSPHGISCEGILRPNDLHHQPSSLLQWTSGARFNLCANVSKLQTHMRRTPNHSTLWERQG